MPEAPVVGLDGYSPFFDPEARWTIWSISEIYQGTSGENKFVPKVKDYVVDPDTFTWYIVESVDIVTMVPTLRDIHSENTSVVLTEEDKLLGIWPMRNPDTYRVYIDRSVTPYALSVDARLKVGGSTIKHCKLFRGSDLAGNGEVISKVYDNNMTLISDMVPMEVVAIDSHTNYSIKAVPPCRCTHELKDGELVTAVFYRDGGHVVSKAQLLVENTGFIRHTDYGKRYITHISLESLFMSETEVDTIEYPLNLPLNGLNMHGIVHYSDGSTLRLPVDGTKFSMYGLDQYVSTIIGQSVDLVLMYKLSEDEVSYAPNQTFNRTITKDYKLKTVNTNNSYTVKVYVYPRFINISTGYQLKFFIMNLNRNLLIDVTPVVYFNANGDAFNGKLYGVVQRLSISLNLADVDGTYRDFIHTQNMEVILYGPTTSDVNTLWEVSHEYIPGRPFYGTLLKAVKTGVSTINIASEITNINEWLTRVYDRCYPLYNSMTETAPMHPSHIRIKYRTTVVDFSINNWNTDLNLGTNIVVGENIQIVFINRDIGEDLLLSVAEMTIRA